MKKERQTFRFKILIWSMVLLLSAGGAIYYGEDIVRAETTVYITPTGSKYHTHKCGNGTYYPTSLSNAKAKGLTPCQKCFGGNSNYSSTGSNGNSGGNVRSASARHTTARPKPIKINKSSALLVKGQTVQLQIRNAVQKVKWRSAKKSIATVSATGKVLARKKGKTSILADAGKQRRKCVVTVEEPELNTNRLSMELYDTKKLKLSGCHHSVRWTTSDGSVVKVSKGEIRAKAVGTAHVRAKVHGKVYACKVTVKKPELQKIILEKSSVQMGFREESVIKVSTEPAEAMKCYDVSFSSSDSSVVSALPDEDRLLLKSHTTSGSAVVTVEIGGLKEECRVRVTPCIISSCKLSDTLIKLYPDEKSSLYCTVTPYDATKYYDVEWISGDETVVKVEEDAAVYGNSYANIEAVGEGETDVTVKIADQSVTCHVIVAKPELTYIYY